jgi:hypothetical protein
LLEFNKNTLAIRFIVLEEKKHGQQRANLVFELKDIHFPTAKA